MDERGQKKGARRGMRYTTFAEEWHSFMSARMSQSVKQLIRDLSELHYSVSTNDRSPGQATLTTASLSACGMREC
jgi:hypothetical protein